MARHQQIEILQQHVDYIYDLNSPYRELLDASNIIDTELESLVVQMPNKIESAKEAIVKARRTSNYRLIATAAGISLGRLIQVKNNQCRHNQSQGLLLVFIRNMHHMLIIRR